jgi:DeoR/GlpR family transcriptional regulator of sugar metabolism
MRDNAVALTSLLSQGGRFSISEIATRFEMSSTTVRRWLNSFSKVMDLRVERGIVIVEKS